MLRRISGRELLVRMTVWWLFLAALLVEFVLYDLALVSPAGFTRLIKITISLYIPLFLLHNLVLNRKRKSNDAVARRTDSQ